MHKTPRPPRPAALLGLLLLLAPVAQAAEPAPARIEVMDWGLLGGRAVGHVEAPDTALGRNRVLDPLQDVPVERADRIEACLGTSFGIKFRLTDGTPGPVPITVEVSHPPMHAPDGRTLSVSRWDAAAVDYPRVSGWVFEQAFELLPGHWTISLRDGDRQAVSHGFDVTVAAGCARPGS